MTSNSGISTNPFQNIRGLPPTQSSQVPVVAVNAATTLTPSQSGAIVQVTQTAGVYTITLPPVQAGLTFTFVCAASAAGNTTIASSSGSVVYGSLIGNTDLDGTTGCLIPKAAAASVVMKGTTGNTGAVLVGDWVKFNSDGTRWVVSGFSSYNEDTAGRSAFA